MSNMYLISKHFKVVYSEFIETKIMLLESCECWMVENSIGHASDLMWTADLYVIFHNHYGKFWPLPSIDLGRCLVLWPIKQCRNWPLDSISTPSEQEIKEPFQDFIFVIIRMFREFLQNKTVGLKGNIKNPFVKLYVKWEPCLLSFQATIELNIQIIIECH